ncbi:MAG: Ribosomal large subunit methyltransferase [Verrucomicrobiota bacterium]|jgi:23S rRNA (cytidine2498-2'-O)-methyltransferase
MRTSRPNLASDGFPLAAGRSKVTFAGMLLIGQAGFEKLLAGEVTAGGGVVRQQGPGWVVAEQVPAEVAFAHVTLTGETELSGDKVNTLAQQIADYFMQSLQGERIEAVWPCVFAGPAEMVGLGRRIGAVEEAFLTLLKKRFSRVAKLATPDLPRGVSATRGLIVWFADFGRVLVGRDLRVNGQRRMADDDLAPSRSYLKIEEAYIVLGREPAAGETVVDLGAAPGGWSYSAAKRGARVIAVDNGPLKGGALNHPRIEHRMEDAFGFAPADAQGCDWLFCDMVEEPHHVLKHIVEPWLSRGWCRRFVVNLKFGRVDPIALLRELRAPDSVLQRHAPGVRIRHLYHDREEFTLAGEVAGR